MVIDNPVWLVVLTAVMVMAALLHIAWVIEADGTNFVSCTLYLLSSFLVGVSTALFRVEIDRVFGWVGTQQTLYQGIIGTLLGATLLLLLSFASEWFVYAMQLVAAPCAVLFLWRVIGGLPKRRLYHAGCDVKLHFPLKFVATSFVQGAALGAMYFASFAAGSDAISALGSFIGRVIAVLVLFVSIVFVRLDFNRLIYKGAFPLVAYGFFAIASFPLMPMFGGIVLIVGFCLLDLVLWSLGACLMKNMGLPAPWIASCPGAALFFGVLLGSVCMHALGSLRVDLPIAFDASGYFVACALLATALFLSSSSNMKYGWGTIRPGDGGLSEHGFESTVRFLAAEHELTNRETEVCQLLALGKTRRFICDDLTVSRDTVKTHVRSIYRKLSVHSQQELIDLVGREREKLIPDQPEDDSFV
ncbi:response regulator transcription factor [Raoultibacter phocaeensis]|uniref:response regulator transcription factor n=1 Tax=Raoultibacter phocaeensis TaxID=2479841 RepID=UPI0015D60E29|nr:LuxR C-terminal-related transcriptional regulator [Raoultibacter phocaeensis]